MPLLIAVIALPCPALNLRCAAELLELKLWATLHMQDTVPLLPVTANRQPANPPSTLLHPYAYLLLLLILLLFHSLSLSH